MQGDVGADKENVEPRRSSALGHPAMVAKSRGLGGGLDVRKEKSGVLAPNATLGNGGGTLESLKERVKLLKLSGTNVNMQDLGFKQQKPRSPSAEVKAKGTLVKSFVGSISESGSNSHSGRAAASESSSFPSQEALHNSKIPFPQSSRNSVDQPEKIYKSHNLSHVGSKPHRPAPGRLPESYSEDTATLRDQRETCSKEVNVDAIEGWVSASAAGQTPERTGKSLPVRSFSDQHKSRQGLRAGDSLLQDGVNGSNNRPQLSVSNKDTGGWSGAKRQSTPYKRTLLTLEEVLLNRSLREQNSQSQSRGVEESAVGNWAVGGDVLGGAGSSLMDSRSRGVGPDRDPEGVDGENALSERLVRHGGSHSPNTVRQKESADFVKRVASQSTGIDNATRMEQSKEGLSDEKIVNANSFKLATSSGLWGQGGDECSPPDELLKVSKWSLNQGSIDNTAVGRSSGMLTEMTGASSSSSSGTPSLSGNSSVDYGWNGNSKVTPPSVDQSISSNFLVSSRKTRITKRLRGLGSASRLALLGGPALRVRVVAEEDERSVGCKDVNRVDSPDSSLVSPILGATDSEKRAGSDGASFRSPSTPDEAKKCSDLVDEMGHDLLHEPRKRKAEEDPPNGDTSQIVDESGSNLKSTRDMGVKPVSKSISNKQEARNGHLPVLAAKASLPGKHHRSSPRLEEAAEAGSLLSTGKRVTGVTRESPSEPKLSTGGQLMVSDRSSVSSILESGTSYKKPDSRVASISTSEREPRQPAHVELLGKVACPPSGKVAFSPSDDKANCSAAPEVGAGLKESGGRSRRDTSDTKDGSEAVSMSQDCSSRTDAIRPASIQDLSYYLGTLSMGEKDMLDESQGKQSLQNLVNGSCSHPSVPPVYPPNLKSSENGSSHPTTSHSGKSVVTVESQAPSQTQRNSPSAKPLGEQGRKSGPLQSKEQKVDANVESVTSERTDSPGGSGQRSSNPNSREKANEAVMSQRKVSENANFIWVNDKRYQKLGKIGKGGSSEVYKVIDSECSIYALKKINLKGRDHASAMGFYQEIEYLERLRGKRNIVQLIDYEVTNKFVIDEDYEEEKISEDACIYMVLEFGEIDLAGILSKKRKEMLETNEPIDDNWLRFYWKHMLLAVKTIHEARIVHADLKPANFLLVKGELKLIDFGIAKAIQNDTTHIVRDSQVGTLNYMSPEAFMTNSKDEEGRVVKCGRSSDIWSLGCILYQMVYGHTPFSHVNTLFAKIQAITSKNYKIDFLPIQDPWLLDVIKKCLTWDRSHRPDIAQLLEHPFLRPDLARRGWVIQE